MTLFSNGQTVSWSQNTRILKAINSVVRILTECFRLSTCRADKSTIRQYRFQLGKKGFFLEAIVNDRKNYIFLLISQWINSRVIFVVTRLQAMEPTSG